MSSPRLATMDFATEGADRTLDWVTGQGPSPPAGLWVQLHIGDPGPTGTANVAIESTRQPITFGPAVAGIASNLTDIDWLLVAATETYTHISVWDSETGGDAWYKGSLTTSIPVTIGADFQLTTGNAKLQHQVGT